MNAALCISQEKIIITLCDLDDTLAYPSPYSQLNTIEGLEAQHKFAKTPEFKQALLDVPPAKWVTDRNDLLSGPVMIITGRWHYNATETLKWLRAHKISYNCLKFLCYEGQEDYIKKKCRILDLFLKEYDSDQIRLIDDDEAICMYAKTKRIHVYQVKDGDLFEL
jgi:hypothetical protein